MNLLKTIFIFLTIIYLLNVYLKSQQTSMILSNDNNHKDNTTTVDIPKPTNISIQLSKDAPIKPFNDQQVKDDKPMMYVRDLITGDSSYDQSHDNKDFINEDIVSPNPVGSTEYRFVGEDEDVWSDIQVSQHPKYYKSNFNNELTNVSGFFKNHQFNDKTSAYSENHLPDRCRYNENNETICEFNDKLENIPPRLINSDNQLINNIGNENIFKNKVSSEIINIDGNNFQSWDYDDERIINGGDFMENVSGNENNFNSINLDLDSINTNVNYSI